MNTDDDNISTRQVLFEKISKSIRVVYINEGKLVFSVKNCENIHELKMMKNYNALTGGPHHDTRPPSDYYIIIEGSQTGYGMLKEKWKKI